LPLASVMVTRALVTGPSPTLPVSVTSAPATAVPVEPLLWLPEGLVSVAPPI